MHAGIAVDYLQLLIGAQRQHMRLIHATFLLQYRRFRRHLEGAVPQTLGHKHHHVLQIAVLGGHDLLTQGRGVMLPGAGHVGRHVNARGRG